MKTLFGAALAVVSLAGPALAQDTGIRQTNSLQTLDRATTGQYNVPPVIVGNGTADNARSSVAVTDPGTLSGSNSGTRVITNRRVTNPGSTFDGSRSLPSNASDSGSATVSTQ